MRVLRAEVTFNGAAAPTITDDGGFLSSAAYQGTAGSFRLTFKDNFVRMAELVVELKTSSATPPAATGLYVAMSGPDNPTNKTADFYTYVEGANQFAPANPPNTIKGRILAFVVDTLVR